MRLLSKMKMRRNRVLEKVNQKVPGKNKEENRVGIVDKRPSRRRIRPQLQRFRNHLQQRRGQHEPRTQRDEILQKIVRPLPVRNQRPANHVRPRRRQSKQQPDQQCRSITGYHCVAHGGGFTDFGLACVKSWISRRPTLPSFSRAENNFPSDANTKRPAWSKSDQVPIPMANSLP